MRDIEQRATEVYHQRFGRQPELTASAPGRVNLIGEHTDYNGGFVLPCAIDRRIAVAIGEGTEGLYSADFHQAAPLSGCKEEGGWFAYPRGIAWALAETGRSLPPFQAAIAGEVPIGSGLSSSAAIESATALALDTFFDLGIERRELALLCQRAENQFVGVNSGIMDQYASLLCREGSALLIDCRSLEARNVPLDLAAAALSLLVCDTRVERTLAATGYNERRAACERAARILGVAQLRDAHEEDLDRLEGVELKRARHVIREDERVIKAVKALQHRDFVEFGQLMYASHASLRDDYEVSTPELNTFVEVAAEAGALGARLTGAGFGGCAIALVPHRETGSLVRLTEDRFQERGFKDPTFYTFHPSSGAEVAQ